MSTTTSAVSAAEIGAQVPPTDPALLSPQQPQSQIEPETTAQDHDRNGANISRSEMVAASQVLASSRTATVEVVQQLQPSHQHNSTPLRQHQYQQHQHQSDQHQPVVQSHQHQQSHLQHTTQQQTQSEPGTPTGGQVCRYYNSPIVAFQTHPL